MQIKKCEHGHYYDEEKQDCCPYCAIKTGEPISPSAYPEYYKTDPAPEWKKVEPPHHPEPPVCIYAGPPLSVQQEPKKKKGFWNRFHKEK